MPMQLACFYRVIRYWRPRAACLGLDSALRRSVNERKTKESAFWFSGVPFWACLLVCGALPGAPAQGDGDPVARSMNRFDDRHGAAQMLAQLIGQCLGALMARKVALNGQLVLTGCTDPKPGIKNALLNQIAQSLIAGVVEIAAAPAQGLESVQLAEQGLMAIQSQWPAAQATGQLMHLPLQAQKGLITEDFPLAVLLLHLELKHPKRLAAVSADP